MPNPTTFKPGRLTMPLQGSQTQAKIINVVGKTKIWAGMAVVTLASVGETTHDETPGYSSGSSVVASTIPTILTVEVATANPWKQTDGSTETEF